jgi:hypothetical protein
MQPQQIVKALADLGVSIRADGLELMVTPKSKVPTDLAPEIRAHKAELLAMLSRTDCTCPRRVGPAGCGPDYPACSACGYTWYCKDCGGCRQCASPGRKVRAGHVGDGQLPPLNRPPATETELRRLIDYLDDPVAFAQWFECLMQQIDPAENGR